MVHGLLTESSKTKELLLCSSFLQGHKRAPSDASVASSEDEKIPLSPSSLEVVPEKLEPIRPATTPTELPVANHVADTSSEEEPAADEVLDTPVTGEEAEIKPPEAEVASPEPETPSKELQQLELNAEDEKEVDTAEVSEPPQEDNTPVTEEPNTSPEDGEPYQHLKVTLTLPEDSKAAVQEETEEKPAEEDRTSAEEEKNTRQEKDRDSDSGSCSTADNSSVDLNLSISSFLSKTKEPGSVSVQVSQEVSEQSPKPSLFCNVSSFPQELKRQKKTLKKTRKFMVDGVEVSVTTSKIITDSDAKNEEMRFLRWATGFTQTSAEVLVKCFKVNMFSV